MNAAGQGETSRSPKVRLGGAAQWEVLGWTPSQKRGEVRGKEGEEKRGERGVEGNSGFLEGRNDQSQRQGTE